MIKKISHIAVVVPELEEAMGFWVEALGLPLAHVEHVADQGVEVAFLPAGESDIELLEPVDLDSGVARYLQRRGPGMHHICFEVEDIVAVLTRLQEAGVPLINEEPTIGTGGKKIAFIHPKGTGGVLVELYEMTDEEPQRRRELVRDMRRRLSQSSTVYTAGMRAFLSGLLQQNGKTESTDETL
jgi:methylmalonyl-CoA/ethylmalonyl-CoA epimerase